MPDLYEKVTNTIVEAIEKNPDSTTMPWNRGGVGIPKNVHSGKFYQGVNILNLWVSAMFSGYASDVWGSYRQWQEAGCQVRKGEKSSLVVFYKMQEWEEDGEKMERPIIRASWSFNADQVDGYEAPKPPGNPIDRLAYADAYVAATGATVKIGGAQAYYRKDTDTIHMPDEGRFYDQDDRTESFYAVLFHELTHMTGHPSRLDRDMGKRFGDQAYAMEELVAELGAAFQCAKLGISPEPRPDHASYIANWLQALKDDKRAIFSAASAAQKAVDYLWETGNVLRQAS